MSEKDAEFEHQLATALDRMDKHKVSLSLLAQGENSPYWTDELAMEITAAKTRLDKYRTFKKVR